MSESLRDLTGRKLSFFERLPYDVRAIIYRHLAQSALPPFAQGFHISTSGFMLSCRSAKKDIEDIAARRLAHYLTNFPSAFPEFNDLIFSISPVSEDSTLAQFRQITVSLPFPGSDFFRHSNRRSASKDKILGILHPLLVHYYDMVHLRFFGVDNRPAHHTLLERGRIEVDMHNLLRDITYLIEHVNKDKGEDENSNAGLITTEVIKSELWKQGETGLKPRLNTKRVCLSWNLTGHESGSGSDSMTLNGKLHRNIVGGITFMDDKKNTAPIFYHLRDEERLVEEMGVESAKRWVLAGDMELIRLLNGINTTVEYCSSSGSGKELTEGLVGACASDFEDCEEEVSRLIYV